MSASEVASNPFWYAKPTAALTSRDRLSICVLAMCYKSVNQLTMPRVGKDVKLGIAVAGRDGLNCLMQTVNRRRGLTSVRRPMLTTGGCSNFQILIEKCR